MSTVEVSDVVSDIPPNGPPPYREIETRVAVSPETSAITTELLVSSLKRVEEINMRLKQIGYDEYEYQVVSCPDYLMNFEFSKRGLRSQWIDAHCYAKKMEAYHNEYTRTKDVLNLKIKELKEKNTPLDDIPDYTFKEERNGIIFKTTIGNYYESHHVAANNLIKFMESSTPVNGKILFDEKNRLIEEKIMLLTETRKMQLDILLGENRPM
jgi:hypothetical protein